MIRQPAKKFFKTTVSRVKSAIILVIWPIRKIRELIISWLDKTEITPPDWLDYVITFPVVLFTAFFISSFIKWLPGLDSDSAKWALSTQTQATAAILGLLIAAVVFRLHLVKEQEAPLRDDIHQYLLQLSNSYSDSEPGRNGLDLIYDEYDALVRRDVSEDRKKKEVRKALVALGKLWVIKQLSSNYASSIFPPRKLKRGQIKHLYSINKFAGDAAITMWEHYFTRPSEFVLEVFDTLSTVCSTSETTYPEEKQRTLAQFAEKYNVPEILRRNIVGVRWKLEGERLSRTRNGILRPFYPTCIILFFAVLLGMLGVTGIGNSETVKDLLAPYTLRWLVGLPVGLSAFGLVFSIATILRIVR